MLKHRTLSASVWSTKGQEGIHHDVFYEITVLLKWVELVKNAFKQHIYLVREIIDHAKLSRNIDLVLKYNTVCTSFKFQVQIWIFFLIGIDINQSGITEKTC